MARHTLSDLFARLLQPVTSAVEAETGRKLTVPQWSRIGRTLAASALRALASLVEPAPALAPEPQPAQTASEVPVAPAVPVADVQAPYGWASLDLPTLMQEQTADREAFGGEFPTDAPRTYGATAAQWDAIRVRYPEPTASDSPAPAKPARKRKASTPAKAAPKGKATKATGASAKAKTAPAKAKAKPAPKVAAKAKPAKATGHAAKVKAERKVKAPTAGK